jgi:hypothetical protein
MKRLKILFLSLGFMCMLMTSTQAQADNPQEQIVVVHSNAVELEHVEAYKIDDAEFTGAVVSNSGFGSSSLFIGTALFALVALFTGFFRKLGNVLNSRKVILGAIALFAVVSFVSGNATQAIGSGIALGTVVGFTDPQQKELKDLFDSAGEKHKAMVKLEVEEAVKGLTTSAELEQKFKAAGLEEKTIEKLIETVEKQGLKLKEFFDTKPGVVKSLGEVLHAQKDAMKGLADQTSRVVKFTVPAETVQKTIVERANVSSSTQSMRLAGIGQLDVNNANIRSLFREVSISPDSNGVIRYMDQNAITRNAAMRNESAAFPESAITWIERTASLQKIADSIPVSMESFRDVNFIEGEVNQLLNVNLQQKDDQQLYDGTGVAPDIKGFRTSAVAFDIAGADAAFAGAAPDGNIYDLVLAIRTAIMNGKKKYMPNFVTMNPLDIFKFKVLKGEDGHYLLPPFVGANGEVIAGMRVLESNQVDVNTVDVGDSRYGTIYNDGGIEIEMGWIDDQFIKDTMTIKARKRTLLLIRTVDETAFKKVADNAAQIALLTA